VFAGISLGLFPDDPFHGLKLAFKKIDPQDNPAGY
jgi:hypothetical protein